MVDDDCRGMVVFLEGSDDLRTGDGIEQRVEDDDDVFWF